MSARHVPSSDVPAFLAALPDERRGHFERVRDTLRKHLPDGYEEVVSGEMLVYRVPPDRYAHGPRKQPLWYAALASGKRYLSLHLMSIYADTAARERLIASFVSAGRRPKMGKACVRFTSADQLPLEAIGEIVGAVPVDRWIELARSSLTRP